MAAPAPSSSSANDAHQEAIDQFHTVRHSLSNTWNAIQASFQSTSATIRQQALQIHSLETTTAALEQKVCEKSGQVYSLEARITELTQSFEGKLALRQREIAEAENRANITLEGVKRANAYIAGLRKAADVNDSRYRQALAHINYLQKANVATNAERKDASVQTQEECPEIKMASFEGALKQELEARSDTVHQAALNVAMEATKTISALRNAYNDSQARVISLEKQLQVSRDVVAKMTKPLYDSKSPTPSMDRTSHGSATTHRIITGTYRPRPLQQNPTLTTLSQDTPSARPNVTAPPSSNAPRGGGLLTAPSLDTSTEPAQTSTQGVIDLTLSPVEPPIPLQSDTQDSHNLMRPAKRQRVDSKISGSSALPSHLDQIYMPKQIQDFSSD